MTLSKLILKKDYKYPYYSVGWFAIAESKEIKKGEVQLKKFSGQDVVLFRTESGKVAVTDAYCPHMGANFGHGGCVEGEELKCPFHGFKFDVKGSCTATGYGTKPSPRAKLRSWPTMEKYGMVFCFYHPEQKEPHYDIHEVDNSEWTDYQVKTWQLESNPVEITENSVDIGHFVHIHGFGDPHSTGDLRLEGPNLFADYAFYRKDFIKPKQNMKIEINIFQYGLGFAIVEAYTKKYNMYTRHLVMPVTIEGKLAELRIASSIKKITEPGRILPILKFFPKKLLTKIIAKTAYKEYCAEVYSDFKIWKNKIYLHPPALSKGDGPIMQYRQWAAQFDYELNRNLPSFAPEMTEENSEKN